MKISKLFKNVSSLWFIGGLLAGILLLLVVRFFTYHPDAIHYHANFAVYINGHREDHETFSFPEHDDGS